MKGTKRKIADGEGESENYPCDGVYSLLIRWGEMRNKALLGLKVGRGVDARVVGQNLVR